MRVDRWVINQPRKVFGILVPTLVATWFLAGVGGSRTPSDGGLYYVGAAFWTVFWLTFVVTMLYAVVQLVRLIGGRR
ncbi:MAG: hypothetical protein QOF60_1909 [Actinomycetota bacterium]|jgi:hypothetical protein|nr:hypothetical protein [Actinomycetota bacterium]